MDNLSHIGSAALPAQHTLSGRDLFDAWERSSTRWPHWGSIRTRSPDVISIMADMNVPLTVSGRSGTPPDVPRGPLPVGHRCCRHRQQEYNVSR
jgi:hypothetical protein